MYKKVVILSILIFVGCVSYQKTGDMPLVTIDVTRDTAHIATPNPVHVKRGHWVHFFLAGTDDLEIQCDAFDSIGHDHGHAWARAKDDAKTGEHKYSVTVRGRTYDGAKTYDPEVMIDP